MSPGREIWGQGIPRRAATTTSSDSFVPTSILVAVQSSAIVSGHVPTYTAASTSPQQSSSPSSGAIIIASVIGGIAGLGLLCVVALCLLSTRKSKMKLQREMETAKISKVESRSYPEVNGSFVGVPVHKSSHSQSDNLLLGMQSPGPIYSPTIPGYYAARDGSISPSPSPYTITPEASIRMVPSDPFLQSYSDGLPQTPGRSLSGQQSAQSLQRLNTSSRISTVVEISPMTPETAATAAAARSPTVSPQSAIDEKCPDLPELGAPMTPRCPTHRPARDTLDTMGFPVEADYELDNENALYKEITIAAPVPRNPLLNQKGHLERSVRESCPSTLTPSPLSNPGLIATAQNPSGSCRDLRSSPTPSLLPQPLAHSGAVARVISADMSLMRESPVLGTRGPPVRISPPGSISELPPQAAKRILEIQRNESVGSHSSRGSTMPTIISDSELERLGVGPRI